MNDPECDLRFDGEDGDAEVLVGILHTAENEFDSCVDALRRQQYRRWSAFVIRGRPNREAHRALYDAFDRQRTKVRYFLKLDADMVFVDDGALERAVEFMRYRPNVDHAEFAVRDWFTDGPMMGLHLYTNRAHWPDQLEAIFVDRPPLVPGERVVVWCEPAPLVHHAPNPTPTQAAAFGVHRAVKVVQPGNAVWLAGDGISQMRVLERVASHFRRAPDERLAVALAGAARVLTGRGRFDADDYKGVATEVLATPMSALVAEADAFWSHRCAARKRALRAVGLVRSVGGMLFAAKRRAGSMARRRKQN